MSLIGGSGSPAKAQTARSIDRYDRADHHAGAPDQSLDEQDVIPQRCDEFAVHIVTINQAAGWPSRLGQSRLGQSRLGHPRFDLGCECPRLDFELHVAHRPLMSRRSNGTGVPLP